MPVVRTTQSGFEILKVKWELVIQLKAGHGHGLKTDTGNNFQPWKLVVSRWVTDEGLDRAKVVAYAFGVARRGPTHFPMTANINLQGYHHYQACPQWIAVLLREMDYNEPIEKIV